MPASTIPETPPKAFPTEPPSSDERARGRLAGTAPGVRGKTLLRRLGSVRDDHQAGHHASVNAAVVGIRAGRRELLRESGWRHLHSGIEDAVGIAGVVT